MSIDSYPDSEAKKEGAATHQEEDFFIAKYTQKKRTYFSMFRSYRLADLLTLSNGLCGGLTVFAVMHYLVSHDASYLHGVFILLPLALICDVGDGYVARMRKEVSLLGQELDSLADLVSFGMAPAAVAFGVGFRAPLDVAVLIYFILCGLSRLARFNATAADLADQETGKVRYFEGTPIPTSLLLVAVLGYFVHTGQIDEHLPLGVVHIAGCTLHPMILMFGLSGSLMISKLHIPKP